MRAARQLHGIERADSIVMDPHKGLGIPYGSGAVLVKRGRPAGGVVQLLRRLHAGRQAARL